MPHFMLSTYKYLMPLTFTAVRWSSIDAIGKTELGSSHQLLKFASVINLPTPNDIRESAAYDSKGRSMWLSSSYYDFVTPATPIFLALHAMHDFNAKVNGRDVTKSAMVDKAGYDMYSVNERVQACDRAIMVALRLHGAHGAGMEGCVVPLYSLRHVPWLYTYIANTLADDDIPLSAEIDVDASAYPTLFNVLRTWRRRHRVFLDRLHRRRLFALLAAVLCPTRARLGEVLPQAERLIWLFGRGIHRYLVRHDYAESAARSYMDALRRETMLLLAHRDDVEFNRPIDDKLFSIVSTHGPARFGEEVNWPPVEDNGSTSSYESLSRDIIGRLTKVAPTPKGVAILRDLFDQVLDDFLWLCGDLEAATAASHDTPHMSPYHVEHLNRLIYADESETCTDVQIPMPADLDPYAYVKDLHTFINVPDSLTSDDFYSGILSTVMPTLDRDFKMMYCPHYNSYGNWHLRSFIPAMQFLLISQRMAGRPTPLDSISNIDDNAISYAVRNFTLML